MTGQLFVLLNRVMFHGLLYFPVIWKRVKLRKRRWIFADPCAHQHFWYRSAGTIWRVYVILQSWADWRRVQSLCARKWGLATRGEELAGFLALEIAVKGVYFVLDVRSQLPQTATGTCCNTLVLAKQLVGGW